MLQSVHASGSANVIALSSAFHLDHTHHISVGSKAWPQTPNDASSRELVNPKLNPGTLRPFSTRIYRENEDSLGQLRVALRQLGAAGGLSGEGTAMNNRLIGQLEEVRDAASLCWCNWYQYCVIPFFSLMRSWVVVVAVS